MRLRKLCEGMDYALIQGSVETEVSDIVYDSRRLREGVMFVCMPGAVTDGHLYISQAAESGAAVIVVERAEAADVIPEHITVIQVQSARLALALMSAAYFGYPDRKLITIGITGTKGKTTTSYMIREILKQAGEKAGLMGTIAVETGEKSAAVQNTTPESYEIHKYMAEMVREGCRYMVMEVSSQGLKLQRTAGIVFDYGVFTNLSADHIGPSEHVDFDEYLRCKRQLFRQCETGIVNADDRYTSEILQGHTCRIVTFSAKGKADLMASDIELFKENGRLGVSFTASGLMDCEVMVNIPGRFSVYNALAAMAVCGRAGIPLRHILEGIEKTKVKGRVEMIRVSEDFSLIIDYAHNELSTRSVLETLRQYEPARLIAVFGCGGNRSKVRRYDIGRTAGELADFSILTADNPRFESVEAINRDIKAGLDESGGRYMEIEDRKEAIAYAVTHARPGDMIILLGKGHEEYLEIRGIKYHFSEHEAVREIVDEIKSGRRRMENDVSLL